MVSQHSDNALPYRKIKFMKLTLCLTNWLKAVVLGALESGLKALVHQMLFKSSNTLISQVEQKSNFVQMPLVLLPVAHTDVI